MILYNILKWNVRVIKHKFGPNYSNYIICSVKILLEILLLWGLMNAILNWYVEFVMNCHSSWHDQYHMTIYTSYGITVLWQILQLWSNPVIPSFGSALYFSSMKKMIQIGSQKLRWLSRIRTSKYAFLYRILNACLMTVYYHKKLLLFDRCVFKNCVNCLSCGFNLPWNLRGAFLLWQCLLTTVNYKS